MTDLNITKDDIGKVFINADGEEEVVMSVEKGRVKTNYEFVGYYDTNGVCSSYCDEDNLIKRKEEPMTTWTKNTGTAPELSLNTIIEARLSDKSTMAMYVGTANWNISGFHDILEYRIVEAAPEPKPEPKPECERCKICGEELQTPNMIQILCVECGKSHEKPKLVELKDLWAAWCEDQSDGEIFMRTFQTYEKAKNFKAPYGEVVAITKGDATGYTPAEGL